MERESVGDRRRAEGGKVGCAGCHGVWRAVKYKPVPATAKKEGRRRVE